MLEVDWDKVGQFCKHLGVLETKFDVNEVFTNELVPAMGRPSVAPVTPGGILNWKCAAFWMSNRSSSPHCASIKELVHYVLTPENECVILCHPSGSQKALII